ncbi:hypothetical protein [Pseudoxanthomonas sp.]|uniref:hypothetical protein n=1 Tax=Pseudoxanthomonas sp. TaxID=1871049 RepID=UPI0026202656|nr:hypothetical protein [Pseudoxanthomonas sp.]WDS37821.1 MAG: hypothetical protein O8I58_08125 [Pseudoxanthomonas sp.]
MNTVQDITEKALADQIRRFIGVVVSYVIPLIAIVVPTLYFVGRLHREAYWRSFGVSASIMKYPSEDYVYFGFSLVIKSVLKAFSWTPFGALGVWAAAMLSALLILILVRALQLAFERWLRKKALTIRRARRRSPGSRKSPAWRYLATLWPLQWINTGFLGFLIVLMAIFGSVLLADHVGKDDAKQDRAYFTGSGTVGNYETRLLAHIKGEDEAQSGVVIGCSEAWCALARRGDVVAVAISDIERFDHCAKSIKLKNENWVCDPMGNVTP